MANAMNDLVPKADQPWHHMSFSRKKCLSLGCYVQEDSFPLFLLLLVELGKIFNN